FCRGFLYLHSDTDFYLWNPSTGAHKQIPAHPITPMIKLLTRLELLSGFAYDHSTDDYLIVSVFCEDNDLAIKLMIFSLRDNKWKPIEVASHLPYMMTRVWYCFRKCGLFLNGSIHWIVHNYETSKNVIIAFDIKEMTISEIALPDDFILSYSNNYPIYYDLLEVGGLISAWVNDLNTVKIWVMQKYGVHSSWTKIIQFSVDPVLHNDLYIACLTKCGDIVGRNRESGLVKFNDKGKLLEKHLCHMEEKDGKECHKRKKSKKNQEGPSSIAKERIILNVDLKYKHDDSFVVMQKEKSWTKVVTNPPTMGTQVLQIPVEVITGCVLEGKTTIGLYDTGKRKAYNCVLKKREDKNEMFLCRGWYEYGKSRKFKKGDVLNFTIRYPPAEEILVCVVRGK
ncbi:F-box protein CPR1-like, partial [Vicia villosa]|uniref:F-box protein CPR1-like n=1 Tax=Vicia villosa TaxID=3911 RepID=UPI00273B86DE